MNQSAALTAFCPPLSPFIRNAMSPRILLAILLAATAAPAAAEPIANPVAVFNGLDKITGRIIRFEVLMEETVQFGALQVTPHICNTRPPTEPAQTTAFVEVDEITLQNEIRRLFTGWMFAASPGLHAVEHPIYDIWLVDCQSEMSPAGVAPPEPDLDALLPDEGAAEDEDAPLPED